MERIKSYTFLQRVKYTLKRKCFCSCKVLGFKVPYVASDLDIHIDWIWRDIHVENIKKRKIEQYGND